MDMKEQSIYGPNYAYPEYMLISRSCEMKGRINGNISLLAQNGTGLIES